MSCYSEHCTSWAVSQLNRVYKSGEGMSAMRVPPPPIPLPPPVSVSKVNGVKKSSKPAEDPVQYSERRITIESKEVLPSITIEEEEEEEKATPTKPMPIDEWLDRSVVLVDCFSEVVEREKVEQTDLIGVSRGCG